MITSLISKDNYKDFIKFLKASKGVLNKQSLTILENVLINENGCIATSLEGTIFTDLIKSDMPKLFNTNDMLKAFSLLKDYSKISIKDDTLVVGDFRIKESNRTLDEFPIIPNYIYGKGNAPVGVCRLSGEEFSKFVGISAMLKNDPLRQAFNTAYFKNNAIYQTDGKIAFKQKIKHNIEMLVSLKKELRENLKRFNGEDTVVVEQYNHHATFVFNNIRFVCILDNHSNYPDVEMVLKSDGLNFPDYLVVSTKLSKFKSKIKAVGHESNKVLVSDTGGFVSNSGSSLSLKIPSDVISSNESGQGGVMEVAFNGMYLIDLVNLLKNNKSVKENNNKLLFKPTQLPSGSTSRTSRMAPVIFKDEQDEVLLMPLRVG